MTRVVWDIETASAKELFSYPKGKYVRLVGYQVDDQEPVVTTDVDELIRVLLDCDRHYSFNGLAFDCVALAVHHDVDYVKLTENAVDLMLNEIQIHPREARRNYPKGYWGLNQICQRYGHPGKTDDLEKLASRYGGFDKIPVPVLTPYMYGDIAATKFLAEKIGSEFDKDPYLPWEHEVTRSIIPGCRITGLKVDVPELTRRREEQQRRIANNFVKLEEKYEIPFKRTEKVKLENPFRVAEGKKWFEEKCVELGIGDLVPRTKKGAVSLTSKGVEKMLDGVEAPNDIEFLSTVLAVMEEPDEYNLKHLNEEFGIPLERELEVEASAPFRSTFGQRKLHQHLKRLGMFLPRTGKSTFKQEWGEEVRQYSTSKEDLHKALELYRDPENQDRYSVTPAKLREFEELVEVIIDVTTERTVYGTIEKHRVGDRIHPEIRAEQATGRWSFVDPGITVMGKKEGKSVEREVYVASEGNVLCCIDLAQIDARIVAAESQDPNYMRLFEGDKDLHSEVAMLIFGRCDGEYRSKAKAGSHGTNYQMGVDTMVEALGMLRSDAERFKREWAIQFALVERWKKEQSELAASGYPMFGIMGRRMKPDASRHHTQGPGLIGQNGTREMMAAGLLRMKWDHRLMLRAIIHDEYVIEIPEEGAEETVKEILSCIRTVYKGVNIDADASPLGKNWGDCYI